jgi:hypothetical protein
MSSPRALVLAPWLPEFDRESGLRRVSDLIDMLLRRDWQVTFGCLYPPRDPKRYVRELEERGVETYAPRAVSISQSWLTGTSPSDSCQSCGKPPRRPGC